MFLQIGKSRIFYETHGSGEPVLILHGGFGSNQDFAAQIAELSKNFKVVAFERPGHGHSADTKDPFTFDAMARTTIDVIEALNLPSVNLVGWSDGAITSLFVALSRPDLVRHLVSVSASFNTSALSPGDVEWIRQATPDSFRKAVPSLIARYDAISPDGPDHFPTIFEKTKKLWLTEPNLTTGDLAKISTPTLVMAADRDAVSLEHTLELFRSVKNAQLCIIPGASHLLLSEKPETTTRAILEFITEPTKL